jgi:predicted Zn-dependent protease
MQALVRSSLLSVTVALLTGESSGVIDNLAGAGVFLFDSGYSREAEQEADRYAAAQMRHLYGSTEAMRQMFERLKLEGDGGLPEWLSTHPDIDSRIEAVGE